MATVHLAASRKRLGALFALLACLFGTSIQAQTVLRGGVTQDVFASGGSRGRGTFSTGSQTRQPNDGPCNNPFGCGRGNGQSGGADIFSGNGNTGANSAGRDVYCQQSPGMPLYGPYAHTGTQTPCGPAFQPQTGQPQQPPPLQPLQQPQQQQPAKQAYNPPPLFHFYYINGMNTPLGGTPRMGPSQPNSKDTCGNYICEYGYVQKQLAENAATRVGNEVSRMEGYTHNVSSQDPVMQNLVQTCTASNNAISDAVRAMACWIDQVRKPNGISAGDFLECLFQSLKLPFMGATFSSHQIEVVQLADAITKIYTDEINSPPQSRRTNYFIVVAHSQGNFFSEGLAYRLFYPDPAFNSPSPTIAANRLGILSLGSPTSYDSLPADFIRSQVHHVTRADDGIHILDFVSMQGLLSKKPWPREQDVTPLWPWRDGVLANAFTTRDGFMETAGYIFGGGMAPLATPFMNAHLIENYLTTPTATPANLTPPEQLIPQALANKMTTLAISSSDARFQTPNGRSVLQIVQSEVRKLKQALLQKSPAASYTQNQQANASSDGWSPPQ